MFSSSLKKFDIYFSELWNKTLLYLLLLTNPILMLVNVTIHQ
jgi:hypothetical protein